MLGRAAEKRDQITSLHVPPEHHAFLQCINLTFYDRAAS